MPLKYRLEFKVTGSGYFPTEALRYDRCSPSTDEDAANLFREVKDLDEFTTPRTIKLVMFTETTKRTPAIGNWRSHCWPVDERSYQYSKV